MFVAAVLSAGAAQKIQADRKAAIDHAVAAVAYRKKIINRLVELINAGKCCPDQDIVDELERKLREAKDELWKVKGT